MGKILFVMGTWGLDDANPWWMPTSSLAKYLAKKGYSQFPMAPFVWSGDLDGVFGQKTDWYAGGQALKYYFSSVPLEDRNVLAHSHGGQVALHAAAAGVELANLVTIATPVRRDMRDIAAKAHPNIHYWQHVHSDHSDWMQIFGSLFDGVFGIYRDQPLADRNIKIPGVGHSSILHDPTKFHYHDVWLGNMKG